MPRSLLAAARGLAAGAALALPAAAQSARVTLLDTFCCTAGGTPVALHAPERGPAWTVDGPGPAPHVTSGALVFEPGTQAVAVSAAPPGDRTVSVTAHQPAGLAAEATLDVAVRYAGPGDALWLRVRWPPGTLGAPGPGARAELVVVVGGAVVVTHALADLPHAPWPRDLRLSVRTHGSLLSVSADDAPLGTVAEPALLGAPGLALAASGPPGPAGEPTAHVSHVAVFGPLPPPAPVCPGLRGWQAEQCVRQSAAPLRVPTYSDARDLALADVWSTGSGPARGVECLFGGALSTWRADAPLTPPAQLDADGLVATPLWPAERGLQTGPSTDAPGLSDLHGLAPARAAFARARADRPFGSAFSYAETARWLSGRSASSAPPASPASASRVQADAPGAGLDGLGRVDLRPARRGEAARAAAYLLALYRADLEGDGAPSGGRAFVRATVPTLVAWHEGDPADDAERDRNARAERLQGNRNPFVDDPTLLRRTFAEPADAPREANLWINELHHTNAGPDRDEGAELAGPAGTDLTGYRLAVYGGDGRLYGVDGPRAAREAVVTLRATLPDEGGGLGTLWTPLRPLRGGCQGLALTDPDGQVLEFLAYGGCRFNALDGPVADAARARPDAPDGTPATHPAHPDSLTWARALRGTGGRPVQQWPALEPGRSLQRVGAGTRARDFVWSGPLPASRGRLNDFQAPARAPNRTSGWTRGDPVPLPLTLPLSDGTPDEDALPDAPLPPPGPGAPADPLAPAFPRTPALGPPAPNPTRGRLSVALAAPPGSRLVLVDALGRTVLDTPAPTHAPASALTPAPHALDLSALPPGLYTLRLLPPPGTPGPALARRLVVAR